MRYLPGQDHGLGVLRVQLVRFGVVCLWFGMAVGLLAALLYTPLAPMLKAWGVSLRSMRPLHLTAGTGWIYLAGLAVVVHFWTLPTPGASAAAGAGAQRAAMKKAMWFLAITWMLGALVSAITVMAGNYSGREYFFVSVPASVLFWVGWLPVAWVFLKSGSGGEGFAKQPAYRWMWMTSFGLFTYAFVETHVFLLPYFAIHPLRDMAVEWKSYGTLVGSFNLLVYGSLAYLGQRLNPSGNYARSRMAFSLFWVGVLNSFTNYGHHTYHLPQTHILKWVSFIISMTEIVILAKVLWDVWGLARKYQRAKGQRWELVTWLLAATTCWTCASLIVSMFISVPALNTLIHGTFVVAGHAMGSMLGIDTMGLLAVLTWIYLEDRGGQVQLPRWPALLANAGILVIWSTFLGMGMSDGMERWQSGSLPSLSGWPGWFGYTFFCGGVMVATGIFGLTWRWMVPRWLLEEPGTPLDMATSTTAGTRLDAAAPAPDAQVSEMAPASR